MSGHELAGVGESRHEEKFAAKDGGGTDESKTARVRPLLNPRREQLAKILPSFYSAS
jgi:hypothetical protein